MSEIDGAHNSNGNSERPKSKKEKKMEIDLNKPYIEGNSSENDSSTSAAHLIQNRPGNTSPSTFTSQVEKKPYIYRPRKPIHLLSQTRSAIYSRNKLARLRQEGKIEKLNEILEKQKKRMRPAEEKHKLETQRYGRSLRPTDIKNRQLREKIRLGTATEEERDLITKQKLKVKFYPSKKRSSERMKLLRQKVLLGTATLEESNRVQRRKAANRASYHRRKNL